MRAIQAKLISVKKIQPHIYCLKIQSAYLSRRPVPGQFVHVRICVPGLLLRRPLSIHKVERQYIYILFKVRGEGTRYLASLSSSAVLDMIGPLGSGFNMSSRIRTAPAVIMIAGGVGVAPLLFLSQRLHSQKLVTSKTAKYLFLGARDKQEILCRQEFRRLGYTIKAATQDGSCGFKGNVVSLFAHERTHSLRLPTQLSRTSAVRVYACGPKEMFQKIAQVIGNDPQYICEVSFEQFMGCGIGVCSACVIATRDGFKKVCKDGPVFRLDAIW